MMHNWPAYFADAHIEADIEPKVKPKEVYVSTTEGEIDLLWAAYPEDLLCCAMQNLAAMLSDPSHSIDPERAAKTAFDYAEELIDLYDRKMKKIPNKY